MAMEDWAPTLLELLRDSGGWVSYRGPNVVALKREIGPHGWITLLSLIYDEDYGQLYFRWDPQMQVSLDVRPLYEKTIASLNDYLNEFKSGFGEFWIDELGHVLFSVSLRPTFEELPPTVLGDINKFVEDIFNICGTMYPVLLEVESGGNVDQVLALACAPVAGHA